LSILGYSFACGPSVSRITASRRMRLAGHVAQMDEKRNSYRILVGKPEGRRPPGRPRCRLLNNIKMDLSEIGLGAMD
jgi:hypothetical protein